MGTLHLPSENIAEMYLGGLYSFEVVDAWAFKNHYEQTEVGTGEPGETMFSYYATDKDGYKTEERVGAFSLFSVSATGMASVKCVELSEELPCDANPSGDFVQLVLSEAWRVAEPLPQKDLFDVKTERKGDTKIYFACPTGKRRDAIVSEFGEHFGACLTTDLFNNVTGNAMPFFLDNGAFAMFNNGVAFNAQKFYGRLIEVMEKSRFGRLNTPDFIVIPDIVCGGMESLALSMQWMAFIEGTKLANFAYYLPIQDGMTLCAVEAVIKERKIDGLFLGGTKAWKYATGKVWADLANKYGLPIHVGGVGVKSKIEWARECGFTSVDSGVAMIHPKHLNEVLDMERSRISASR